MEAQIIISRYWLTPMTLTIGHRYTIEVFDDDTYHGFLSGIKDNTIYFRINNFGSEIGFSLKDIRGIQEI